MNTPNSSTSSSIEQHPFLHLLQDKGLVEALSSMGISEPTPIQAAAIPPAVLGRDVMAQAQTGSGKTLAFVLPLLRRIRALSDAPPGTALVITPTRELAVQICTVIEKLCPDIEPACIIGGDSAKRQVKSIERDGRIVVGTPGRLLDLIERRELPVSNCRHFVLDEADEMLSMGFIEDVRNILRRLPRKRQGMFFSATLSPTVTALAHGILTNPDLIEIAKNPSNTPAIRHMFASVSVGVADKARALCAILREQDPSSAIIFCNTKSDTELVEVFMRRRGFDVERINSDLSQRERNAVLERLRSGALRFLIATDVAARGIDIDHLQLVINYTLHSEVETYVHRSGRTGRAGREGTAISLISPQDKGLFSTIRRSIDVPFEELVLPAESSDALRTSTAQREIERC